MWTCFVVRALREHITGVLAALLDVRYARRCMVQGGRAVSACRSNEGLRFLLYPAILPAGPPNNPNHPPSLSQHQH